MNIAHIALCALFASLATNALARLTGEVRDDVITSSYHNCLSAKQPSSMPLSAEDQSKRSRYCRCGSEKFADALDIDTVKQVESGQRSLDPTLLSETWQWCKQHYAEFDDTPPSSKIAKSKETHGSILFNGKTHRFTAFRQYVYTNDYQLVRTVELNNGRSLFDFQMQRESSTGGIFEVSTRQRFGLVPLAGTPQTKDRHTAAHSGIDYDWSFLLTGGQDGWIFIDSRRNLMASHTINAADGLRYVTHYVRSQALMCDALKEARTRAMRSAAMSIFKEVLVAAIRSYAGASYSGGNFTAYTTSGQAVSGTYTRYDPSWLGEHYSRGMDAVFQGTASLADINRELTRLECDSQ
jgi:hypothetical protein